MPGFHVNDYGIPISVTIMEDGAPKNISAATVKQFVFKRPGDGLLITKTATFLTDGSDGVLDYTVESGVLSKAGLWKIQAIITFADGLLQSEIGQFSVESNMPT